MVKLAKAAATEARTTKNLILLISVDGEQRKAGGVCCC
jgi:hypothetical protein